MRNSVFYDECNCNLQSDLKYKIKVYIVGEYVKEVIASSALAYGQQICVSINGDDDIMISSEYEVTLFQASNSKEEDKILDMLNIDTIKGSKGEVNITFPIICIGKVNFGTTFQENSSFEGL